MNRTVLAAALLLATPAIAVAQSGRGLTECAAGNVELGTHEYRLLDRQRIEVGRVTQGWTQSSKDRLRQRVVVTGSENSYTVVSTLEVDPITLWPLSASVRTDTLAPSVELILVDNRVVGRGLAPNGDTVQVAHEVQGPVLMPGTAAALVPLIDWDRCESVDAAVLAPPAELKPVTFTRERATLPFGGEALAVYAVRVKEGDAITTVFVPRTTPRVELHRENSAATLVWVR